MKPHPALALLAATAVSLTLAGCGDDTYNTYESPAEPATVPVVSKPTPPQPPAAQPPALPVPQPHPGEHDDDEQEDEERRDRRGDDSKDKAPVPPVRRPIQPPEESCGIHHMYALRGGAIPACPPLVDRCKHGEKQLHSCDGP